MGTVCRDDLAGAQPDQLLDIAGGGLDGRGDYFKKSVIIAASSEGFVRGKKWPPDISTSFDVKICSVMAREWLNGTIISSVAPTTSAGLVIL